MQYADDEWLAGKTYTFYEYEDHFNARPSSTGSNGEFSRSILIRVFRYFYLYGGFDDAFWNKLLQELKHPSEAKYIVHKFNINDIYLV